jgi:hypothetical protein
MARGGRGATQLAGNGEHGAGPGHTHLRVRVEIMGSQKCGIVGKSQSVLITINPIIFTRTRTSPVSRGTPGWPARPFPSSIFLDKNRRDIGKSQSIWSDSKMETAGSPPARS